jgi:hypothetical protein
MCLASAIQEHLCPLGVLVNPDPEVSPLMSEYYIWVQLPDALTAARVCDEAFKKQNLVLGWGETSAVPGGDGLGDLNCETRLCFM